MNGTSKLSLKTPLAGESLPQKNNIKKDKKIIQILVDGHGQRQEQPFKRNKPTELPSG
jgi:hypothetical protein